jgi:hypothetical protein
MPVHPVTIAPLSWAAERECGGMNTTDFVRLLGAIRDHLTAFGLPHEIASVDVSIDSLDGERITVHLCSHQLPGLTAALG